jgi:hypothetical protein
MEERSVSIPRTTCGARRRTLAQSITQSPPCIVSCNFEAFYHSATIRSLWSSIVCRIESGEYVTIRIGSSKKLDERGKQVIKSLFIDVPEVEIKVGH